MKSFKVKDLPVFILLAMSLLASLVMGCSGGGGGSGPSGSSSSSVSTTPTPNAPAALTAGMKFTLVGAYQRMNSVSGITFPGTSQVVVTMQSPTAATYNQTYADAPFVYGPFNYSGTLTYTSTGPDTAVVFANNYPYVTDGNTTASGILQGNLTFTSATGGTYTITSVNTVTTYSESGSFTLTP